MSAANSLTNGAGGQLPMANGLAHVATTNGGAMHVQETRPAPPPPTMAATASAAKKGKQKQASEPSDPMELVAKRISELEQGRKGEKGETEALDRELKKASRELHTVTARMSEIQKIDHLTKRCTELLHDMKKHERESIKNKKRADQLQKEKDQSRTDLSRTVGLKEKLEKLCRELQKENNKLKNENKTLKDNQVRSQNSWDEKYTTLLQKLDDCQDEKDNPRKQVVDVEIDKLFRSRFKSTLDQYELRELHFHSHMRTKEIEVQWNIARYEKEKKTTDSEMARSRQLNEQVQTFSKTEAELRNQLNVYVDKFKQVEDTLNNSNDLFLTFRKEMEDMSKKTKRLEKENDGLRRKHESMKKSIFDMAEERQKNVKDVEETKKREQKLKSIITQMQQQGRSIKPGSTSAVGHYAEAATGGVEGDDSEYDYEEESMPEDRSTSDLEVEYGDDDEGANLTEEEPQAELKPFGPEPPPSVTTNGH